MASLLGFKHSSKPVTAADQAMSKRHLAARAEMDKIKEPDADDLQRSISYNKAHAAEHNKAVEDRQKELVKAREDRAKLVEKAVKARSKH